MARVLRANATDAERRFWRALKAIDLPGTHFRRQVSIGRYVADFACLAHRLVIELDGGGHAEPAAMARDAARTVWLAREGYRVLRFWNNEVSGELDGVLATVHAALHGGLDAEPASADRRRAATPPPRFARTLPLKGRVGAPRLGFQP